jgi:hypothetical protein
MGQLIDDVVLHNCFRKPLDVLSLLVALTHAATEPVLPLYWSAQEVSWAGSHPPHGTSPIADPVAAATTVVVALIRFGC